MTSSGTPPAAAADQPGSKPPSRIEELLAECIERAEAQGPEAVAEILARHPEHEADLRRWLARLEHLGFSGSTGRLQPPRQLGGYRILETLGEGGMGIVYLAEDEALERKVALKVMRPGLISASAVSRFLREAQVVARLDHPNVVRVYGFGEDQGALFLAMELIEGRGLDELCREAAGRRATLPTADVARWGRDIARALQCAHEAGVVHRDVKPSNIRVAPDGRAVLLDFGLARDLESATLSRPGSFLGSPAYASPEQVSGERGPIGPRTDVYSLGITLYEAVTGGAPFSGKTSEQVFRRILSEDPEPPRRRNPALPRDLESVILKATQKDPGRRYQTAGELADDLQAFLEFRPVRARPPGLAVRCLARARRHPVAAAALATSVLALFGFLLYLAADARAARRAARQGARRALEQAEALRAAHDSRGRDLQDLESKRAALQAAQGTRYLTRADFATLDRSEDLLRTARRDRERTFYEVLRLIAEAEKLDPEITGTRELRAKLHLDRMQEALAARDSATAAFYRELVERDDTEGRLQVAPRATVTIETTPPGGRIHVFRFQEQAELFDGGEPRLVPVPVVAVPVVAPASLRPGTWSLRVVATKGELHANDLVIALGGQPIEASVLVARGNGEVAVLDRLVDIDGRPVRDLYDVDPHGATFPLPEVPAAQSRTFTFARQSRTISVRAPGLAQLGVEVTTPIEMARRGGIEASVFHDGEVRSVQLPAGLDLALTTQPLLLSPASRIGTSPATTTLELGSYLVVATAAGHETARVPLEVVASTKHLIIGLEPEASGPAGFVRIPRQADSEPYWIQEREVVCAEYLEFLNDPTTLAEVAASAAPIRFPRDEENKGRGGEWPRGEDGRFRLGPGWQPRMPIVGISWQDAQAYAAWRTRLSAARGEHFRYALPTNKELQLAATAGHHRLHVFGDRFRQHWIKTCFARPSPGIEPVQSFPLDESPFGVFDLAGSASEWSADWYWQASGQRALIGGSWAHGDPLSFRVDAAGGSGETFANGTSGMRLVARRK